MRDSKAPSAEATARRKSGVADAHLLKTCGQYLAGQAIRAFGPWKLARRVRPTRLIARLGLQHRRELGNWQMAKKRRVFLMCAARRPFSPPRRWFTAIFLMCSMTFEKDAAAYCARRSFAKPWMTGAAQLRDGQHGALSRVSRRRNVAPQKRRAPIA